MKQGSGINHHSPFFKKITEPASASSVIKHWLILTVKVVLPWH